MTRIKKIFTAMLIVFMSIAVFKIPAQAASISVSAPGTVSPGQSFTVTINVGSLGGNFSISATGGFSVSQSSVWMEEGGSTSITVTAPSSGSGTISVSGSGLMDFDSGARVDAFGSASVTVQVPATPPSNGGSSNNTPSGGGNSNTGGSTSGGTTSGGNTTPTTPKFHLISLSNNKEWVPPLF